MPKKFVLGTDEKMDDTIISMNRHSDREFSIKLWSHIFICVKMD